MQPCRSPGSSSNRKIHSLIHLYLFMFHPLLRRIPTRCTPRHRSSQMQASMRHGNRSRFKAEAGEKQLASHGSTPTAAPPSGSHPWRLASSNTHGQRLPHGRIVVDANKNKHVVQGSTFRMHVILHLPPAVPAGRPASHSEKQDTP